MSFGAILATFSSRLDAMALVHSAGGAVQPAAIAWLKAETTEPMSPTTGATISTLESISFGSISTWMNFFGASPQLLPLPCESSQLRRGPPQHHTPAPLPTGG